MQNTNFTTAGESPFSFHTGAEILSNYRPAENLGTHLFKKYTDTCFNTKIFQILYTGCQHCAKYIIKCTAPVNREKAEDKRATDLITVQRIYSFRKA